MTHTLGTYPSSDGKRAFRIQAPRLGLKTGLQISRAMELIEAGCFSQPIHKILDLSPDEFRKAFLQAEGIMEERNGVRVLTYEDELLAEL